MIRKTAILVASSLFIASVSRAELPSGSLDADFGGAGRVFNNGAAGALDPANYSYMVEKPVRLASLSDGRFFVPYGLRGGSSFQSRAAISLFFPSGVLDSSFGSGGRAVIELESSPREYFIATGLVVDRRNGDLIVTVSGAENTNIAYLLKLTSNGRLVPDFGQGGMVRLYDSQGQIGISQPVLIDGGKIFVLDNSGRIRSFLPDGSVNTGFNNGMPLSVPGMNRINCIAAQGPSKLLVAGDYDKSPAGGPAMFGGALARLDAAGKLDPSFGTQGITKLDWVGTVMDVRGNIVLGGGSQGSFLAVLSFDGVFQRQFAYPDIDVLVLNRQSDGKILMGGSMGVHRINRDFTVDASFTTPRKTDLSLPNALWILVRKDGKILYGGPVGIARVLP